MQSLEANAKNLSRACLVVVRARQRAQDQLFFRLFHRGSYSEMNRIGIEIRGLHLCSAKSWRQMTRLNQPSCRENHRTLQSVSQFADVTGPTVCLESLHHFFLSRAYIAAMLLV